MLNIIDIKNRIKSIEDTAKITKAMQLISVAKMNKALVKYEDNQPYFKKVRSTTASILRQSALKHRYIDARGGERTAFIVIASDKGMAGDFNNQVLNLAYSHIESLEETYVFTIGIMARDFFVSKGINIDIEFLHTTQNPTMADAARITYDILELYDKDLFDKIYVVYTEKTSVAGQFPTMRQLLPVKIETLSDETRSGGREISYDGTRNEGWRPSANGEIPSNAAKNSEKELFQGSQRLSQNGEIYSDAAKNSEEKLFHGALHFEPDEKSVLGVVITEYLTGVLYSALVQSVAAEHFKRMTTMRQATKNADEMLAELKIKYNRARQENITTAILEIGNNGIDEENI
jgi:F-type H+-transporting ATPase subunit gamma